MAAPMESGMLTHKLDVEAPAKGKTDWARVDAMTDEDIARAVAEDPDAAPILSDEQMRAEYKLHPPRIRR
jgi:hypothetical protein